ncbi:MAG: hypothetical protein ABJA83_04660 [Burkholderiaceae bacterium]
MAIDSRTLPGIKRSSFYAWAALVILAIVFAGFARSYYLKSFYATPELPGLLHLHGFVMTLWFAFFLSQVSLVAARRTDVHRRVGALGGVLALLVVVVGMTTAITAARVGHTPGPPPLVFLAIPVGDMVVFPILVGAGLVYRRRSEYHKRLMLLASLSLLTAAIARIPLDPIASGGLPMFFALTDLCIVVCIAFDSVKHRRLHSAFGWGLALIVASQALRFGLAGTAEWAQFAEWLIR